jgi:hypothetical protein
MGEERRTGGGEVRGRGERAEGCVRGAASLWPGGVREDKAGGMYPSREQGDVDRR